MTLRALALLPLLALTPISAFAQQRNGFALGAGIGRFIPLRPLATAAGSSTEFKLDDASATSVSLDYWWRSWLGTRVAFQWVRTDLSEPEGSSLARLYALCGAVLLVPIRFGREPPFIALGGGLRRYDVNAPVIQGNDSWDLAPRQNRPMAYAGAGAVIRLGQIRIRPEAGVFLNEFEHNFPCDGCPNQRNTQLDLQLSVQILFGT
jgi:hypothetical protein